jgi:thiamine-monophosphate kinase
VGEFGLIKALTAGLARGPAVLLGPGDDAAVVAAGDGRVVVSTDTLVQDRHFRLDLTSALDLGHKAAAVAIADIAAMGAVPTGVLVAVCLPVDTAVDWVLDLVRGIDAECAAAGAAVVGGDVVSADQVVLTITVLGDLQGRSPLTRAGARAGDVVAVCGTLGRSAAGLAVQERGVGAEWPDLLAAHHRPHPPYRAGPEAARLGATALIDVSDGLLADLGHLAAAGGVAIDLSSTALAPDARLAQAAQALDTDASQWVLTGGEDHALAGTFPAAVQLPVEWRVVGQVAAGPAAVTVDGRPWSGAHGWDHFG